MSKFRTLWRPAALAAAIVALYLYKLNGVGAIGPDEPRYAAIGRTMAASGDFITPVLWGHAWFEKPPLLYWMTALGTNLGLGPDLCGRLPVVILSLAFLASLVLWTGREFGWTPSAVAAAMLATSAGWLTYSSFCLTDLPLAVFFSLAVFAACSLLRADAPLHLKLRFVVIGASLGLAALAKGLVPIALALPFFWYLRAWIRYWWLAVTSLLVVALPWYWLVYARNGSAFVNDFFIKHHLERLYSASLLHTQPLYYYVPVLLAGLFPWTPLFGLLFQRRFHFDARRSFLAVTCAFGFFFFSVTRNKLPHYILPLLPSLFVLLGSYFEGTGLRGATSNRIDLPRPWLLAPAILMAVLPIVAGILPPILEVGRLSATSVNAVSLTGYFFIAMPLLAVVLVQRPWTAYALIFCSVAGMMYLKATSYPVLDRIVSPRVFWQAHSGQLASTCNGGTNRDWLYGLSYYRGAEFAECQTGKFHFVLRTVGKGIPVLLPLP